MYDSDAENLAKECAYHVLKYVRLGIIIIAVLFFTERLVSLFVDNEKNLEYFNVAFVWAETLAVAGMFVWLICKAWSHRKKYVCFQQSLSDAVRNCYSSAHSKALDKSRQFSDIKKMTSKD